MQVSHTISEIYTTDDETEIIDHSVLGMNIREHEDPLLEAVHGINQGTSLLHDPDQWSCSNMMSINMMVPEQRENCAIGRNTYLVESQSVNVMGINDGLADHSMNLDAMGTNISNKSAAQHEEHAVSGTNTDCELQIKINSIITPTSQAHSTLLETDIIENGLIIHDEHNYASTTGTVTLENKQNHYPDTTQNPKDPNITVINATQESDTLEKDVMLCDSSEPNNMSFEVASLIDLASRAVNNIGAGTLDTNQTTVDFSTNSLSVPMLNQTDHVFSTETTCPEDDIKRNLNANETVFGTNIDTVVKETKDKEEYEYSKVTYDPKTDSVTIQRTVKPNDPEPTTEKMGIRWCTVLLSRLTMNPPNSTGEKNDELFKATSPVKADKLTETTIRTTGCTLRPRKHLTPTKKMEDNHINTKGVEIYDDKNDSDYEPVPKRKYNKKLGLRSPSRERMLACKFVKRAQKEILSNRKLASETTIHSKDDKHDYKCPHCKEAFFFEWTIPIHINHAHLDIAEKKNKSETVSGTNTISSTSNEHFNSNVPDISDNTQTSNQNAHTPNAMGTNNSAIQPNCITAKDESRNSSNAMGKNSDTAANQNALGRNITSGIVDISNRTDTVPPLLPDSNQDFNVTPDDQSVNPTDQIEEPSSSLVTPSAASKTADCTVSPVKQKTIGIDAFGYHKRLSKPKGKHQRPKPSTLSAPENPPITTTGKKKKKEFVTVTHGLRKTKKVWRYTCKECKYSTDSQAGANKHYQKNHPPVSCSECNHEFNNPSSLRCHSYTHKTMKYHCRICNQFFAFDSDLSNHKLKHRRHPGHQCQHELD